MINKDRCHQSGFSLLEVLISIAILAAIAVTLTPTISATARTAARIDERSRSLEDLRSGGAVFENLIAHAVNLESIGGESAFKGNPQSMSFISIDPISGDPTGYEIQITANGGLVLSQLHIGGDVKTDPEQHYLLLDGLIDARFSYLGSENDNAATANTPWRTFWNGNRPPKLVRLTANRKSKRRNEPLLIESAPLGHAPLNCRFDPVSRMCRGS